jgi:diaminopimelate decarboxylase
VKSKTGALIIGGGVIGCSVAYHLTQFQDSDIVLVERGDVGEQETRVSAAMVMHQTQDEPTTQLAKIALGEYLGTNEGFPGYLGREAGFRPTGSILYATEREGAEKIRQMVQTQKRLNIRTELLSGTEVRRYAPMLRVDDIMAASYCPSDGYLDTKRLVQYFVKFALTHGAEILENTEAIDIEIENGEVKGVETTRGHIETPIVINAAGACAPEVGRWAGIEIPVNLNKRDIVLIPKKGEGDFPILEDVTSEWYVRPYNDHILIGVGPTTPVIEYPSSSEVDADPGVDQTISQFLKQRMPDLAQRPISSRYGGIRSFSPDNRPILGPTDSIKGLLNCYAMSGFGVTNAPVAGQIIAEIVKKGRVTDFDLDPFLLGRFPESRLQWRVHDHNMKLGKQAISSIATRFGTPLYIYSADIIKDRLNRLRDAFNGFDIWFSVKSNPNIGILKLLAKLGVGAGATSLSEIELALSAGFPTGRIAFGGPGKNRPEIELAIRNGITIDIESLRELRLVDDMASHLQEKVPISIRVNVLHRPSQAGEFMAGIPSKFGLDEENVKDVLAHETMRHVEICGIHAHPASQVLDPLFFLDHYTRVARLSKDLAAALGFRLKFINFGGGLGIPYSEVENAIDLRTLGHQTLRALSSEFPSSGGDRPELQVELGRYLVAESGIFLTEIIDLKASRGTNFIITDSGISGLSRPAMPWAQQHPCSIVSKRNLPSAGTYTIVGRTCLPSDVLCEKASLPNPTPGDVLAVHNAGAYGYTMSMLLWSGLTPPVEVLFQDNEFYIATRQWKPPSREAESGRGKTMEIFSHSES